MVRKDNKKSTWNLKSEILARPLKLSKIENKPNKVIPKNKCEYINESINSIKDFYFNCITQLYETG